MGGLCEYGSTCHWNFTLILLFKCCFIRTNMPFCQCGLEIRIGAWVGGQGIKVSISIRQSWLFKLLYANFFSGFLLFLRPVLSFLTRSLSFQPGSFVSGVFYCLQSRSTMTPSPLFVLAAVELIVSNKKWRELARAKWLEMQISGR